MDADRIRQRLNVVLVLAVLDALLLVPLVYGLISGADVHKEILGPIHGGGYVLLVLLTAYSAYQRLWGWWFPLLVIVTFGPPGSIIGDRVIRAKLP